MPALPGEQLEPLWDDELRWQGCAQCKGEWVSHEVLDAMFAARGQAEPGEPPVWLNQYDHLPCPSCGRTMDTRLARRVAGDVTVNVCHLHGTWLDRDGLSALLRGNEQAERMRQILLQLPGAGALFGLFQRSARRK